jgi:hypothetical protein
VPGASVIQCCYAARGIPQAVTQTDGAESQSAKRTFFDARKTILNEKISLNVSRLGFNPACRAGVLTSRPNFSARFYERACQEKTFCSASARSNFYWQLAPSPSGVASSFSLRAARDHCGSFWESRKFQFQSCRWSLLLKLYRFFGPAFELVWLLSNLPTTVLLEAQGLQLFPVMRGGIQ